MFYLKYFSSVTQLSIHPSILCPNFHSLNPIEDSHVHPFCHLLCHLNPWAFCFGLFFLMWPTWDLSGPKRVHIFTQPLNPKKRTRMVLSWSIPILAPTGFLLVLNLWIYQTNTGLNQCWWIIEFWPSFQASYWLFF